MIGKRVLKVVCAVNTEWWHIPAVEGIKRAEGVDFNHVAFVSEFGMVYEAVWPRSRAIRLEPWQNKFAVVRTYELHLDPVTYNRLMGKILDLLNKNYSIWQCAMIWFAQNARIIQKTLEWTSWNGKRAMICSEFVGRPLADMDLVRFDQGLDSVGMDEIEIALRSIAHKIY